jgi:predicted amidophosphoribosyltransferase
MVNPMTYCHNCGEKLPKDALFCPKCGTKAATVAGASAGTPSDEMREAFTRMSQEMEKAFSIAAKEVQEAFQTARTNIQKNLYKEPIICPNCGEKNLGNAVYCSKCGKPLPTAQAEKKPKKDN